MTSLFLLGASEGGLFDIDATLPLMAVQVVLLTYVLNKIFFQPVGRVVEEREDFVFTSRAEAKKKIAEVEKLEVDLKNQLLEARQSAQAVIAEAEKDSENLYKEAIALANAESNASREKARLEIDSQKDLAIKQLQADADQLGDLIVQRLLTAK